MTTLQLRKSIDRSPLRLAFVLIPLALASFALSPTSLAQLPSPPPDGGYPNGNTAEGDSALFSLTTGFDNTATPQAVTQLRPYRLPKDPDGPDLTAQGAKRNI